MEKREQLAELEHEQWCHWTRYFLDSLLNEKSFKENIVRWAKQAITKYKDLTEEEKDKDRIWADKIINIIKEDE